MAWLYTDDIEGSYAALAPIIGRYGADAARVYVPYPTGFRPPRQYPLTQSMIVMTFDRRRLTHATAAASTT
jgi:hypothetical protein